MFCNDRLASVRRIPRLPREPGRRTPRRASSPCPQSSRSRARPLVHRIPFQRGHRIILFVGSSSKSGGGAPRGNGVGGVRPPFVHDDVDRFPGARAGVDCGSPIHRRRRSCRGIPLKARDFRAVLGHGDIALAPVQREAPHARAELQPNIVTPQVAAHGHAVGSRELERISQRASCLAESYFERGCAVRPEATRAAVGKLLDQVAMPVGHGTQCKAELGVLERQRVA